MMNSDKDLLGQFYKKKQLPSHVEYTAMFVDELLVILLSSVTVIQCDYGVTIYPEYLQMGQVTHFDSDRWMGKNGLDAEGNIPLVKQTGAVAARWIHRDFAGGFFEKAPEDPNKKGYPDPAYFRSHQYNISSKYLYNLQGYGNPEMVMELKDLNWPHWMDTSQHNGHFPNNIDAAAEFVYLLLEAVDKGTHGKLPAFFEVINEPEGKWQDFNWTTVITFHQAVAQKLKPRYPKLKVGGPTLTGASAYFDRTDFKIWKKMAQFMDMSLTHLDFFSFHSYSLLDVRGDTHQFHRNSEAKLFGILDLIDSYAHKKRGKSMDVIVSEYGLADGITGINVQKPSGFLDWAYIYQHNMQLVTFLERRDIMRKAVAFLITYTDRKGQASINYSILDKHHKERDITQAFKFWKNIQNNMAYLRVDSEFHNAEREVVPHVLVDKSTGTLTILLHNHDQKPVDVKLNFDKGWFNPKAGKSTCEYLNAQMKPILETDKPVHVTHSAVTVPAEATCYFQFNTSHSFANAPSVTQDTYYSENMVIPVNKAVHVQVNISTLGKIEFARLRFGVSLTDKSANPEPKLVQINNHSLKSFYSLHTANGQSDPTVWQMYEFSIPVSMLKHGNNNVRLTFEQSGGYVSTVAVVLGVQNN